MLSRLNAATNLKPWVIPYDNDDDNYYAAATAAH